MKTGSERERGEAGEGKGVERKEGEEDGRAYT